MAEFGYHTIGTGGTDNPSNNIIWVKATSTPASNGTLTLISVYCQILAGTPTVNVALYADSAGSPTGGALATGTAQTVGASLAWVDVPISVAVTSGTQYWFAFIVPNGVTPTLDINGKFDTNGGATESYFLSNGGAPGGTGFLTFAGASAITNERWSVYGTYTPSGGGSPFFGATFENPKRQRRSIDALSWSSNDLTIRLPVAPVTSPFFVSDWPNPRGRTPLNTSFTSNYAIDDSPPFAQRDWPNPVRAKRNTDGLSWEDELNTLLFTAPGVPFSQLDWPNPVRAKRSTEGLSWQDELNTLLFTAPVTMPFRQLSWPNPLGKTGSITLRGFVQASAFWMLKDTFYGAPGQPPVFTPPINPRGPQYPMELRGFTHSALTILPTPPVFTFNPAWAQGSNRTVGFGIEPE